MKMKMIGALLILAALATVGIIIPEQVSGYFHDGEVITRDLAEIESTLQAAESAEPEAQLAAVDRVESRLESVASMKAFRVERLQGIGIVGGGGVVAIGLGIMLIVRGRRREQHA